MSLDILRQPERIAIGKLRTDGGTQPRAGLDQAVVAEYAELFAENSWPFPPVVAFYDGTEYWLADGFHRTAAAQLRMERLGWVSMPVVVDVRQGERRDAVLFSVGANAEHGLRRTNEDKRRAVTRLLEDAEWSQWSDREIGRRARVSPMFVGNLRKELSVNGLQIPDTTRTATRNGVVYSIDTSHIGKAPANPDSGGQAEYSAAAESSLGHLVRRNRTDEMLEEIDERLREEASGDDVPQTVAALDGKLVVDWTDEDWDAYTKGRRPPAQQATADDGPQTAAATTGGGGLATAADAFQWLRFYQDGKGRTWRELADTQVFHANSPCFQAFVRAYPGLADPRSVLRRALLDLRRHFVTGYASDETPVADAPGSDDKNALSAEGRDGITPVLEGTPVRWSPDPDNAKELQRLGSLYTTLGHVVRLLGFGEDGETAEGYGFGVEFQRLLTEAGGLREEVRKLTPKDRVNG